MKMQINPSEIIEDPDVVCVEGHGIKIVAEKMIAGTFYQATLGNETFVYRRQSEKSCVVETWILE